MGALSLARQRARPLPDGLTAALLFAAVALVLRMPLFGNPVVDLDEQFYLLVGERMLHGALPYADIWDRKPIGLFLIYAAASAMGGATPYGGVIAYQLIAWASVSATSFVIYRLARMIAPRAGAIWAGISYPLYLMIFSCVGGQSPVFYNLLMASGALLLVSAYRERDAGSLALRGAGVMLLAGVAMQIKYTAVFEGFAFGLPLLARAFTRFRAPARAAATALWIACALLPTAAVWTWYAGAGHGAEFVQSNFTSIFGRRMPPGPAVWRLVKETAALTPFWLAILAARRLPGHAQGDHPEARPLLLYWAASAVFGFLVFGSWLDHYVAPLLAPLAVIAAPAFGWRAGARRMTLLMLGVGLAGGIGVTAIGLRERGNADEVERITALIRAHLGGGCLYVYEAQPVFYRTTDSCLLTRFAFPAHLSDSVEAGALGVSSTAEERRILDQRPAVVLVGQRPMEGYPNRDTRRMLMHELASGYTRFASAPLGSAHYDLYRRIDAPPR
jgi:hypothetical protein